MNANTRKDENPTFKSTGGSIIMPMTAASQLHPTLILIISVY